MDNRRKTNEKSLADEHVCVILAHILFFKCIVPAKTFDPMWISTLRLMYMCVYVSMGACACVCMCASSARSTAVVVTSHLTGAYGCNGYLLRFRIDKNSKQNTFYLAQTNSRVIFLTLCLCFHRFMSHCYRFINESNIRYHYCLFDFPISDFFATIFIWIFHLKKKKTIDFDPFM